MLGYVEGDGASACMEQVYVNSLLAISVCILYGR